MKIQNKEPGIHKMRSLGLPVAKASKRSVESSIEFLQKPFVEGQWHSPSPHFLMNPGDSPFPYFLVNKVGSGH